MGNSEMVDFKKTIVGYFDEQVRKAEALDRAGLALHLPAMPASAAGTRASGGVSRRGSSNGRSG